MRMHKNRLVILKPLQLFTLIVLNTCKIYNYIITSSYPFQLIYVYINIFVSLSLSPSCLQIDVEQFSETIDKDQTINGNWNEVTAGGRITAKAEKDPSKEFDNPHWCRNPQYFLNLTKPTHFKVYRKQNYAYSFSLFHLS